MDQKFKPGETVYLIGNTHFIDEAVVVMTVSGLTFLLYKAFRGINLSINIDHVKCHTVFYFFSYLI